jgi:branched-chain amino acid transport system ATP-binding protein
MTLFRVSNLHSGYGKIRAIQGISIEINEGELVALIGANGAGKSSLLRAISGLIRPWSGSIHFENRDVTGSRPDQMFDAGVVHVPEGRAILKRMTTLENLRMGALRQSETALNEDLEDVYELFPRLAERQLQKAGTLSGGEQQMLALGRALMSRPKLLMLDEPSLGLAPKLVTEMFNTIRALNRGGMAILLVEQYARLALESSNRAYVLDRGQITLEGQSADLIGDPAVQAVYLGSEVGSGKRTATGSESTTGSGSASAGAGE